MQNEADMKQQILSLFETGSATLALCKEGALVYSRFGRGIAPALELLDGHAALLSGADVYDLIVGKAAASVFILGGAKSVFGFTMSDSAAALLKKYGVPCAFQTRTPEIINRRGTGLCPFEQAIVSLDSPEDCLPVIRQTLARLREKPE